MNQINGNGGTAPGPNQFQQLGMHHHLADPQQQNQQQAAMAMNNFDHGMATSVSFASVQSLCDVLRELPLPSAAVPKSVHTKTLTPGGLNSSARNALLNDLSVIPQIQQALYVAKQQVNEIQFLDTPFQETFCQDSNIMPSTEVNTPSQPMNSNLIRTLASQNIFYNQPAQTTPTSQQQLYGNNSQQNIQQQQSQQQQQLPRSNAPNATPGSSNSNMSGNMGDFNTDLVGIEPSIGSNISDIQLEEFIGDCDMQSSAMHSSSSNDTNRNVRYTPNQHHQQQHPSTTPLSHHDQQSSAAGTPTHHQAYSQAHSQHVDQQQQQHVTQKNSMQSPHVHSANNDHYGHQQQQQQNNQHYNNNGGYDHAADDNYGSLGDRVKNRQREAAAKANHANASSFSYSSPSSSVYSSQHTPQHQLTPQHTPPVHQQQLQHPQQPAQQQQTPIQQTLQHPQQQQQQQQQVSANQQQNNYYSQQNNYEKSNQAPAVKNENNSEFDNNQYQQQKRMKIEHIPTYVVPPPPPPSASTTPSTWQQRKQPPPRQRTGIEHKPAIRAVKYEFTDSEYSDALLMCETVDIVTKFEQIIDSILAASCNSYNDYDDDEYDGEARVNGMSFNVKIDSRQLKEIFVLSAKLKQSSRVVEIERKKVILFMTVLSNQLNIWLTRYKAKAAATSNPDDTDIHDLKEREQYWELCSNACQSALHIMTSAAPNKDPAALISIEESIDTVMDFLSHNLNSATHVSTEKPTKGKAKQAQFNLTKKHVTRWTQLLQLLFEFITMRPKGSQSESFVMMLTRVSMSALFLLNNTPEMQFVSIEIACNIFENYPDNRMTIFEELNSSLSKIQIKKTQKKNFVLSQILIKLSNAFFQPITKNEHGQAREHDVASLDTQFSQAMQYLSGFLSILCKRCANQSSNSDTDFKAILEVLLNDLLDQLHSPHSTAALLLLHIIIKLFISYLGSSSKTVNLAMKNLSIDCLSTICSRYAQLFSEKDEVLGELQKTFSAIEESEKAQPVKEKGKKRKDKNKDKDKEKQEPTVPDQETVVKRVWPCLVEYFNAEGLEKEKILLASLWSKNGFTKNEARRQDFFEKLNSKRKVGMNDTGEESIVDITTAALCIQYMEFAHFPTNQRLFELAMGNITALFSGSTNTAQKSRAMKCMTNILTSSSIENASSLLTRPDLQNAMKSALGDPSTSVREATVDLIGRFVLQSKDENLCEQYCDIISERIMDTGISVRKRVIKILRDFSFEFPQFKKCGEIAAKIVRRINDEGEGIRKLVVDSCRELWFSNVNTATIKYKMNSMIHVIETMMKNQDSNMDSMQNLFDQLIKDETVEVAGMICDLIVEEFLLDDKSDSKLTLLAAIHCLAMIAHCEPLLVAKHCNVLQSFMSLQFENRVYQMIVIKVIQTIELLLPHMKSPSSSLLNRIEEELIKNMVVRTHQVVIQPTLKCLSVLVRCHTKNTRNVMEIFEKYKRILLEAHEKRTLHPPNVVNPKVARSVYTCGFFIKYFHTELSESVDTVRETSMEIVDLESYEPSTRRYAINAIGLIIDADPKMCLLPDVKHLFTKILTHTYTNNQLLDEMFCNQVLDNFKSYLSESIECDADAVKKIEWAQESLKKMQSEDDLGSTQSQIIQIFLSHILVNALNPNLQIRRSACSVINVIHSGGHVHPLQLVPHLIAITCDDDRVNRTRADHVLLEIERKYSGFTAMKAKEAVGLSALFCQKLKCPGFRVYQESVASGPTSDGAVVSTTFSKEVCARMTSLYKTICTTKQSRRGFVTGLLRHFDAAEVQKELASEANGEPSKEKVITLEFLIENILFFPYAVMDEILYILNVLECTNSINATNITQLFKEIIQVERPPQEELDAYYSKEKQYKEYQQTLEHMKQRVQQLHQTIMQQQQYYNSYSQETYQEYQRTQQQTKMLEQQAILPPTKPEVTDLEEIDLDNEEHQKKWADKIQVNMSILFNNNEKYSSLKASLKAVYFTTILRVLLKEIYVLKDEKISEYSSNDTKAWEKPVHRRTVDSTHFHEVLETALPQLPNSILEVENLRDVELQILEEWKRFRSVSIHNVDPCFKQSMLGKLFTGKGNSAAASAAAATPVQSSNAATTSAETESPTRDGGSSEAAMNTPVKQNRSTSQQHTPTTPKSKHKSSKKKHDKKKHRRRVSRASSSEESEESSENDDDDDDYM